MMMPLWSQHLLVLVVVGVSLTYVARQALASLAGRKSGMGGCGSCSGCATTPLKAAQTAPRTVFIPLENLSRRK